MLWDYSGPVPVQDTLTLLSRRPWYSMEYNDVVSALALQPWGMTDITSFLAGHQVGLKQYELTNHLGNVQATVSDYPYLRSVGEGDTIKLRNPALASAYDYYPFGMLMPDRYVSDTTSKCITISQPQWISSWTNNIYSAASWVWPGYTPMTGGGTTPASSASVSGGTVNLVLSNGTTAPAMLDFHFSVAPVTPQQIVLDVASTMPQIGISVMQQVNGQWVNLAATTAQAGLNTLTFTPAAAQVKLRFYRMDAAYTSKTMSIKTVNLQKRLLSQQTVLVDVCDEVNDKYRFGFNGQEKVNEWAGIGNFMDYKERGQDTRIARFLSVDALSGKFPMLTPYQFGSNSPIMNIDLDGLEGMAPYTDPKQMLYQAGADIANAFGRIADNFSAACEGAVSYFRTEDKNGKKVETETGVKAQVEFRSNFKDYLSYTRAHNTSYGGPSSVRVTTKIEQFQSTKLELKLPNGAGVSQTTYNNKTTGEIKTKTSVSVVGSGNIYNGNLEQSTNGDTKVEFETEISDGKTKAKAGVGITQKSNGKQKVSTKVSGEYKTQGSSGVKVFGSATISYEQ